MAASAAIGARFLIARAQQAVLVVAIVVTLVFALAHLAPGDPFSAIDEQQISSVQRDSLRAAWGYDQPLWRQYGRWMTKFASGDFGWSHSRSNTVSAVLREAVPNTLALMIPAVALGLLAGVALGTWQAVRRGRLAARIAGAATLVLVSTPDFIVALVLLSLFALKWRLAPPSGMFDVVHHDAMSFAGRVRDALTHLVLPASALALIIAAGIARYQRTAMLEVMHEDYLRTARAKGVPEHRVVLGHALRNSLGPVIAIGGLLLPAVFAGAVFVERIFGWPGMGLALVDAIGGRDYALVQAIVLLGTLMVALAAVLAEVVAALVNPRLRLDS